MNKLSNATRKQILGCISEGMGMRATSRLCDVSITTVMKLLVELGEACQAYQNRALRGLACKRIEADEIWSFIGAKEKNVSAEARQNQWGNVWTGLRSARNHAWRFTGTLANVIAWRLIAS